MFWLIRKIFWIGVLVAIVYYGSNYQLDGKPVKQYVREFFDSPLVQSAIKAGKEEIQDFLSSDVVSNGKVLRGLAERRPTDRRR